MMRKIHRVALAAALKRDFPALIPSFGMVKAPIAKAFGVERRFGYQAAWGRGTAFLLVEPASTATDDYFTLDIAWVREGTDLEALDDALTLCDPSPWRTRSRDEVLGDPAFRLSVNDLWSDSPSDYRGTFRFSTAASRYAAALWSALKMSQAEREERAFQLMQQCTAEERALTDEGAAAEIAPAVRLCLRAVAEAARPAFDRASTLAGAAPTQVQRS